jgi:hypothetical protein
LLRQLGHADTRPSGAPFPIAEHTFDGRTRPSVAAPVPSRITWDLSFPRRSRLTFYLGVPEGTAEAVACRVGISDDRIYESLVELTVPAADVRGRGWTPVTVDLSLYAGPKWSLFYRPDRQRWRLVLALNTASGAPGAAYIGEPGIDTDAGAAREYVRRQLAAQR